MRPYSELEVSTPSDQEILTRRSFAAPPQLVFECWTKPERLRRWMTGPNHDDFAICEIDLRVGGQYRFVWRMAEGAEMTLTGTYLEVIPAQRLVCTERFDTAANMPESISRLEFSAQGEYTIVTQTISYASKAMRDAALQSGMTHGIKAGYARLEQNLADLSTKEQ